MTLSSLSPAVEQKKKEVQVTYESKLQTRIRQFEEEMLAMGLEDTDETAMDVDDSGFGGDAFPG